MLPDDEPIQDAPIVRASTRGPESLPFWKTIPRYEREYSFKDFSRVLSVLSTRTAPDTAAVEHFPAAERILFRSGRECLFVILKALKLRARARVGVPLYCCGAVFESIAAAGCVPVFLDVDLNTYSVDLDFLGRIRTSLDVIVVIHTFGYPANLSAVRACLGSHQVPIVEDCAQALFSESEGHFVGTQTQASFFSFGLHKPAAVGGGGLAVFNDPDLAQSAARESCQLTSESVGRELRHVLICWARSLAYCRPIYGALLASALGRFRDRQASCVGKDGTLEEVKAYSPARMRWSDQTLLESRIGRFRDELPALSRNTQFLRSALQNASLEIPAEPSHGVWNHFLLPVRYGNANRRTVGRQLLRRFRVDTGPLYRNCIVDARRFGYTGECPKAEEAAQTVCTVPNHACLSASQIEFIGEALRRSAEIA